MPSCNTNVMDRRVLVEKLGFLQAKPGTGAAREVIQRTFSVWCRFKPIPGNYRNERIEAGSMQAVADAIFHIRYRSDISIVDRLVLDTREYDIVSIIEFGRRKEFLEITARSRRIQQ